MRLIECLAHKLLFFRRQRFHILKEFVEVRKDHLYGCAS